MRRKGKRVTACFLTAAMVLTAASGCQGSGKPLEPDLKALETGAGEDGKMLGQETGEGADESEAKAGTAKTEDEDWMKNQKYETGRSLEAEEPKDADILPEDYEGWNRFLEEKEISREFAKGMDQFAYKSGSAVLKGTEGNGNYSPLSLYYTLALAGCGARGETAGQILENLGVEDRKELADQCSKLYQWYVYQSQKEREMMEQYGIEGYRSAIRLGNSLWISDQLAVGEEYQKLAAEKFFASSYGVDFADPETAKRMGAWIAGKTNGVLEPQLTLDPGTVLAILNTLYFYGGWTNPFSPEMTQEDSFTLKDGTSVTVPFLNRTEWEGAFRKGEGYTLSYLSTDNNCRMVFLLPDEGKNVEEFLENPQKLQSALETEEEDWVNAKVIWKVPKFEFASSYQLNDILKAMGMERMFGQTAEFGGISSDPLLVSSVIQESHIGVDEQGVEGAAYTMMAMARGAMIENEETAEMILDRPFLYGIRDDSHGVWLFLGVCQNPAEEGGEAAEMAEALLKKAESDVILTSAPEIYLTDPLSSTMNNFLVMPGDYSWNWKQDQKDGEMVSLVACGSHPLEYKPKQEDMLKIPNYNKQTEVGYVLHCAVMPRTVTVREWDISQQGKQETALPAETVYQDEQTILLKHDKIYELVAEWPQEELEKNGFFGSASYVVMTD